MEQTTETNNQQTTETTRGIIMETKNQEAVLIKLGDAYAVATGAVLFWELSEGMYLVSDSTGWEAYCGDAADACALVTRRIMEAVNTGA